MSVKSCREYCTLILFFIIYFFMNAHHGSSDRPTLLSLNRFEKKKNAALAISSFAILRAHLEKTTNKFDNLRLVIAG
jgi:Glycosyl transferases group 1